MERDLTEDLKLSRFHLETAAEDQPSLQRYYGDQVAEKQKARDKVDNRLELRSGELRIELKSELINGKAPTADDLTAMVAKHLEIVVLKDQLADAAYELKLAQSAERAIQDKKSMVETETRLYVAGYFSTPNSGTGNAGSRGSVSDLPPRN